MYITIIAMLLLVLLKVSPVKSYALLAIVGALAYITMPVSPLLFASIITAQAILLCLLVQACNSRLQITVQVMQVLPGGA